MLKRPCFTSRKTSQNHKKDHVDTMLVNGEAQRPNGVYSSPLVGEYPHPLKIAIVGAGIGGLSAAIALRRQGHQVDV